MSKPTEEVLLLEQAVKVATEAERAVLLPRKKPYWLTIGKGQALGYVKWDVGGLWVARLQGKGDMILGTTPEDCSRNDFPILTFAEAMVDAQAWFLKVHDLFQPPVRISAGLEPWRPGSDAHPKRPTVGDALDELLMVHENKQVRSLRTSRSLHRRIKAMIGDIPLNSLATAHLQVWQSDLVTSLFGSRDMVDASSSRKGAGDPEDPEQKRRRHCTANRFLTFLKAALNLAYARGWIDCDLVWRRVRPFPDRPPRPINLPLQSILSDLILRKPGKSRGSEGLV
jgi:hypothetical protein